MIYRSIHIFGRRWNVLVMCLFGYCYTTACGWLAWARLPLHRGAAIFETVSPLVDLSFVHGIIGKGLQNLLGVLSFSIMKLLADSDKISLFVHLARKKKINKCTLNVWTPSVTAGSWRDLKISKHAQEGWSHIPLEGFRPSSISFGGKIKVV